MRKAAHFAFAFAALAGCAHDPPLAPVELHASWNGDGCRFDAEGRVLAAGSPAET